jgi:tetratricopeptide (TPR) repeat protein
VARGILARRQGDRGLAEASFRDAIAREPRNGFANVELALTLAAAGQRDEALARLKRAERLNPRQRLIDDALKRLRRGESVMPAEFERALSDEMHDRLKSIP